MKKFLTVLLIVTYQSSIKSANQDPRTRAVKVVTTTPLAIISILSDEEKIKITEKAQNEFNDFYEKTGWMSFMMGHPNPHEELREINNALLTAARKKISTNPGTRQV